MTQITWMVKPLTMESAVEILRKDGSALASLEEETILNLKETYVNSVGLLGEICTESL